MYSKQVLKHFKNPHNQGKMENPTVIGVAGNPVCGDTMKVYIKVKSKKLKVKSDGKTSLLRRGTKSPLIPLCEMGKCKIEDIKFETLGCAAAIASSSVLTDMAKGKTLDEALKITKEDVVKKLGGLPLHKEHCSLIAVDALGDAIKKLR
ncbi:MAG: iron-sulfur cluster assembly scaffold protein [bacterium]